MRELKITCDICKKVIPNGNNIYTIDEICAVSAVLPCGAPDRRKLLGTCELCYECMHALESAIENVIDARG